MVRKDKILTIVLMLVILSSLVEAVSIGVSPGRVRFDNMMRGGYAERTLKVSTNSNIEIIARFDVTGDVTEWLSFEPYEKTFSLSSSDPYEFKVIVNVPEDAASDSYSGKISFITDRFGDIEGRAGGFVRAGVMSLVDVIISDDETKSCRAGAFDFDDIEIGFPLVVSLTVFNDGNVRIRPPVSFDIWDQEQKNLIMSGDFISPEILPTTERRVSDTIANSLDIGQYWANVYTEDCGVSDLLTFSVVEKGGIVDRGVFEQIVNKPWAYVDETVEIDAVFRNEGPRTVYAKFNGDIKLDNKIIEVIETEEIDVPAGETSNFITYFTPITSGRYVINGRVVYNRKLTFEKSSILNVNYPEIKRKAVIPKIIPLMVYLVILITIIFMIRRIMKSKKRRF